MKLFNRRRRSWADIVRAHLRDPDEGSASEALLHRLVTFSDDMKVEIYTGDIRNVLLGLMNALDKAREELAAEQDISHLVRLQFDWNKGMTLASDTGFHATRTGGLDHLFGIFHQVMTGLRDAALSDRPLLRSSGFRGVSRAAYADELDRYPHPEHVRPSAGSSDRAGPSDPTPGQPQA